MLQPVIHHTSRGPNSNGNSDSLQGTNHFHMGRIESTDWLLHFQYTLLLLLNVALFISITYFFVCLILVWLPILCWCAIAMFTWIPG